MKTIKTISILLITLSIFGGCSPKLKVSSDYDKSVDFSLYKTFSFYHLQTKGNISQLNAERIYNAIKSEMMAKGYTEIENNPDLMVNAVTMLKDKQTVTANTSYYSYGGMYRPYGYWGGGIVAGNTTYNTRNYKAGTFTIDIVDAKSKNMVWQGVGSAEIDKAPKDPGATIKTGVAKIMASFPPKK